MRPTKREPEPNAREARLQAMVDHVFDAILTIGPDAVIETANPAVEWLTGLAPEEVSGKPLASLLAEESHAALEQMLTDALAFPALREELTGRRADGRTFPVEVTLSPMEVGDETRFVVILRDITERRRVDRLRSEFVSTVSHELRTPLTSIRGALGLVAACNLPPKCRTLLDIAVRNCDRLVRLINDLLDIQKIESGRFELHPHEQPLIPLLEHAIDANAGYGTEHDVHFVAARVLAPVRVNVDADAFAQVMTNLLSNAAKFSPRGGEVVVRTSHARGHVRVEVVDRGRGIPDEFRSRIFQKFSQADSSDARDKGGTGLGLSICKALIEKMGGTIGFSSVLGEGTTFYFDLPTAAET